MMVGGSSWSCESRHLLFTRCRRPLMALRRIEWSDYVNYGGPFPTSEEAPPDYEPPKWNVKQLWNFSDLVETHRDNLRSGTVPHAMAQDPIAQELLKLAEAKGTIDLKKLTSENDSD